MSVTAARGFTAAGIAAGIKENGSRDLAVVVNHGPSHAAAGVFTSNRVQAAPVHWSRQVLADGKVRAVVINSGGANACTGPKGIEDTYATAEKTAGLLDVDTEDVAICSTGLIGVLLPLGRILAGLETAVGRLSASGGEDASRAIMTTDSVPKTAVVGKDGWTVGGMAKGAGMLA
ncbi:bifunctional ornithine acetyltransferase/N-acetylglutamate synthase, partial [Streptomyces sp. N35]|uniref:bifunctional ornithine acetyltransferase/N-acetylglutamate synthase n=1 Tax=Streptomyces sp. N35 TaxID=2795730 RepID=UPI0018F31F55